MTGVTLLLAGTFSAAAAPAPIAPGQVAYTTSGTYSWVVPTGVTSVCAVLVGGGGAGFLPLAAGYRPGGGGGGGLRYINNLPVTPGETITVVVGQAGLQNGSTYNAISVRSSQLLRSSNLLVEATGAQTNPAGGSTNGQGGQGGAGTAFGAGPFGGTIGGGNGGNGFGLSSSDNAGSGGGGGAGGYSGNGGRGGGGTSLVIVQPIAGSGGGGGGGGGGSGSASGNTYGTGGGGVGLLGQGSNGTAGVLRCHQGLCAGQQYVAVRRWQRVHVE